jgi:hypothetical protein
MVIKDVGNSLAGFTIDFKYCLPTTEEVNSLKQCCLTQGDTTWNPSSFSDQVVGTSYQQDIHNEQKKSLNFKFYFSYVTKVDLDEKGFPKLVYFDSSDAHEKVSEKNASLVFHIDKTIVRNINHRIPLNIDHLYKKALPAKIDYEKLSPYFAFRPHDVIQHTFRQKHK